MQDLPHHYRVAATAQPEGDVDLSSDGVASIPSAAPPEFGGPGDRWSPEALLVAAVASCFILSFKAIARASRLPWTSLSCDVSGTLERIDGTMKFTEFRVNAHLEAPADTSEHKAQRILEKAEASCLVTNSLTATRHLDATVVLKS